MSNTHTTLPSVTAKIWRNVSSPAMKYAKKDKVSVFQAVVDSKELLNLSGHLNVRREKGGSVKKQMLATLDNNSDSFRYLNGGITIVSKTVQSKEVAEGVLAVLHRDASIINGTQTQGALREYHGWDVETGKCLEEIDSVEVDVTIIETLDEDLITDITVARNVQNTVKDVSVFGRKGVFDPLNKALNKAKSPIQLATSETDKNHFETGKALQLLFAIMPDDFWYENVAKTRPRTSLYSSKAKWMKFYGNQSANPTDESKFEEIQKFMTDMIKPVLDLYIDSQSSNIWDQKWWRTVGVRKTKDGLRVVDGFLIPFIYAHSSFVENRGGKWQIVLPENYDAEVFVQRIKKLTGSNQDLSNPQTFGKSDTAYEILQLVAERMM